jgi:DNA-directed RNA polymerase subunit alpha
MAVTRIPIPDWAKTQKTDARLELSLAEIELAVRTVNCLEDEGIFTVQDLLERTPQRLLEIPNLGERRWGRSTMPWRRSAFSGPAGNRQDRWTVRRPATSPCCARELCRRHRRSVGYALA